MQVFLVSEKKMAGKKTAKPTKRTEVCVKLGSIGRSSRVAGAGAGVLGGGGDIHQRAN